MTEYTEQNISPDHIGRANTNEQPNEHRNRIEQLCIEAFRNTRDRTAFTNLIRALKPFILWKSDTPTLDLAYTDGFTAALSLFKPEAH